MAQPEITVQKSVIIMCCLLITKTCRMICIGSLICICVLKGILSNRKTKFGPMSFSFGNAVGLTLLRLQHVYCPQGSRLLSNIPITCYYWIIVLLYSSATTNKQKTMKKMHQISYFALDQLHDLGNVSDGPLSHTLIMPARIFYFYADFDENILRYYCWHICVCLLQ